MNFQVKKMSIYCKKKMFFSIHVLQKSLKIKPLSALLVFLNFYEVQIYNLNKKILLRLFVYQYMQSRHDVMLQNEEVEA